tara:strand:+ start:239 stop:664 length:426 start_codon:yes stop_codon:yes gene_type:complete
MFAQLETDLHALLDGAVPGVTLHGTLDPLPEIGQSGTRPIFLRTEWGGAPITARTTDAAQVEQRFAVSLYVAGARASESDRTAALAGLTEILRRLIGWQPTGEHSQVEFDAGAPPDEFGGVWRYSINITIPSVTLRVQPQE